MLQLKIILVHCMSRQEESIALSREIQPYKAKENTRVLSRGRGRLSDTPVNPAGRGDGGGPAMRHTRMGNFASRRSCGSWHAASPSSLLTANRWPVVVTGMNTICKEQTLYRKTLHNNSPIGHLWEEYDGDAAGMNKKFETAAERDVGRIVDDQREKSVHNRNLPIRGKYLKKRVRDIARSIEYWRAGSSYPKQDFNYLKNDINKYNNTLSCRTF